MSQPELFFPQQQIREVFANLPAAQILSCAVEVQKRLTTEKELSYQKGLDEFSWVTKADLDIQQIILDYFAHSSLAESYYILAEEGDLAEIDGTKSWYLVIDPLDGTGSFCKQEESWGVMVGACDLSGTLRFSWNMISSGEIFQSHSNSLLPPPSVSEKIALHQKVTIEVYDYNNSAAELFPDFFEKGFNCSPSFLNVVSLPAAVWAGWKLYQKQLDALLWLPSTKGKQWYPYYDLILLGAIKDAGFSVILGKLGLKNAIVAVAANQNECQKLYNIGLEMVTTEQKHALVQIDSLNILDAWEPVSQAPRTDSYKLS